MQTDSERPYLPPIVAAAEQQKPGGKKRTLDVRKGYFRHWPAWFSINKNNEVLKRFSSHSSKQIDSSQRSMAEIVRAYCQTAEAGDQIQREKETSRTSGWKSHDRYRCPSKGCRFCDRVYLRFRHWRCPGAGATRWAFPWNLSSWGRKANPERRPSWPSDRTYKWNWWSHESNLSSNREKSF